MALQIKNKFEGLSDIILGVMGQVPVPFPWRNGPAAETQASRHNESKHVRGRARSSQVEWNVAPGSFSRCYRRCSLASASRLIIS
jgi:hypothetical protein